MADADFTVVSSATPEPGTLTMLLAGAALLGLTERKNGFSLPLAARAAR
jgi:hypothetical protein